MVDRVPVTATVTDTLCRGSAYAYPPRASAPACLKRGLRGFGRKNHRSFGREQPAENFERAVHATDQHGGACKRGDGKRSLDGGLRTAISATYKKRNHLPTSGCCCLSASSFRPTGRWRRTRCSLRRRWRQGRRRVPRRSRSQRLEGRAAAAEAVGVAIDQGGLKDCLLLSGGGTGAHKTAPTPAMTLFFSVP